MGERATRPGNLSDEEAAILLRKLPVRLEERSHRPKTQGIWTDAEGREHRLISGESDYFGRAKEFAASKRFTDPPGTLGILSHVEIKFAMMMRDKGLQHETVVINKETCDGEASCDVWLPFFLPPGARLTVFGPNNFKETYPKESPSGETAPT